MTNDPVDEAPDRRARILDAAIAEFAEHGLAGARVDRIAARAEANKQLIYYYFDDKSGLFDAAVRAMAGRFARVRADLPEQPAERLVVYFDGARRDRDVIRILQWEALAVGEEPTVDEESRSDYMRVAVESLRDDQRAGLVPAEFDVAQLFLSFQALAGHPFAFPQMTRHITGLNPSDEEFGAARRRFLAAVGARLFGARTCSGCGATHI